jgi:hypothetical protein
MQCKSQKTMWPEVYSSHLAQHRGHRRPRLYRGAILAGYTASSSGSEELWDTWKKGNLTFNAANQS